MFISRNDGRFNNQLNHFDDAIINLNTFARLGRAGYTEGMINRINTLKEV